MSLHPMPLIYFTVPQNLLLLGILFSVHLASPRLRGEVPMRSEAERGPVSQTSQVLPRTISSAIIPLPQRTWVQRHAAYRGQFLSALSSFPIPTWVQHSAGYRGRRNFRQHRPSSTYVGAASRCWVQRHAGGEAFLAISQSLPWN